MLLAVYELQNSGITAKVATASFEDEVAVEGESNFA